MIGMKKVGCLTCALKPPWQNDLTFICYCRQRLLGVADITWYLAWLGPAAGGPWEVCCHTCSCCAGTACCVPAACVGVCCGAIRPAVQQLQGHVVLAAASQRRQPAAAAAAADPLKQLLPLPMPGLSCLWWQWRHVCCQCERCAWGQGQCSSPSAHARQGWHAGDLQCHSSAAAAVASPCG